jgi:hypothetical protein
LFLHRLYFYCISHIHITPSYLKRKAKGKGIGDCRSILLSLLLLLLLMLQLPLPLPLWLSLLLLLLLQKRKTATTTTTTNDTHLCLISAATTPFNRSQIPQSLPKTLLELFFLRQAFLFPTL